MSDILGTIFGKTSKDKSSSTSSSTSHSGNYAFPYLQGALAPTTQYLQKGGDMLGALLGINNPGNPGGASATAPTTTSPVANPLAPSAPTYDPTTGNYDYNGGDSRDFYSYRDGLDMGSARGRYSNRLPSTNPSVFTPNSASAKPVETPVMDAYGGSNPQEDALNTYANSAGMKFLRDQGIKSIEGSQAAKGLLQSGSTGMALDKFGQGLAQTYLNQYMDQLLNYSRLGAQGAGILADAGNYSDGTSSGSSQSKGTGGKQGIVQTILGNPSAFSQGG